MTLAEIPFEEITARVCVRSIAGDIGKVIDKELGSIPEENVVRILWPNESISKFFHVWTSNLEVVEDSQCQPE